MRTKRYLRAFESRTRSPDCGPIGISTSLASAHVAIDHAQEEGLSKLDEQFGALFHTRDFLEGRNAEAEGRKPVYQGR